MPAEATAPAGRICVVTGGSGFIGKFLIRRLITSGRFERIYNFDLRETVFEDPCVIFRKVDVRLHIDEDIGAFDPAGSWLFNLAALCREPGFKPREYFETNSGGAVAVTGFAERMGFRNLFFTSTMSSYGRMDKPTPETMLQCPETPYGISKAIAEGAHLAWMERDPSRRLVICRPGVIFGPGDRENVPRMMKAVRKGYFVFPGNPGIVKGYGYVFGLLDSVEFVMSKPERLIIYNYAERECQTLRGMVNTMQGFLGKKAVILRLPSTPLVGASYLIQFLARIFGFKSPIHPVRVRKVSFPTNLKPEYLILQGFDFKYPLEKALEHWKKTAPADFA